MKVLVFGGRDYADRVKVFSTLDQLNPKPTLIIEGGATGADRFARQWAASRDVPCQTFDADWNKYRRAAGAIRNTRMLVEGMPDRAVSFPGGKGTANMLSQARKAGLDVLEAT